MSAEKILIADDRQENLSFLADSVLRPEGYMVITAVDGKQALDKALAEKPDLIITDLKMPRMTGLELMAALRKASASIPVILTTFYGSEQTAIEAFRLGAKDYIIKPYDFDEMLASVERALIEQRLRRETEGLKEGVEVRQHLEERVRQLNSLCGIGRALHAIHDFDEVMRVSVEGALYLTEADAGQLFLVNPDTGQLELRAVRGPSESRVTIMRQAGADPTTAHVLETGQATIGERSTGSRGTVSRLVVPLRTSEQVNGVLAVDAKPAHIFTDNDRYQLGILAGFVAVALANARLIQDLREQAGVQPEPVGAGEDGAPERVPVGAGEDTAETVPDPALTDSLADAQMLSSELRTLADMAQALAAKLEAQIGEGPAMAG
jgi:two-component system NtrC family sensor kinase